MSRCFPFPPPNYCKESNLNRDPRLTEPIKKEDESSSMEKRKDKKRVRKEKKDKSEKPKHKERSHKKQKLHHNDVPPITAHVDSKAHLKKSFPSTKDGHDSKPSELIKNKLQTKDEKSVITEERTLQVVAPEPCESSESTENSSKAGRKHEANNPKHSTLRFKLPLQKHIDQKPAVAGESSCASDKNEPKVLEAGPGNAGSCFPDRKAKVPKNYSGSEATYSIGQTAPNSQVPESSPALQFNRTPSPSVQTAAKPKDTRTSEAARYSGHTTSKAKFEAPSSSGWTAPKPTILKASQPNEATRILGQTPPEPKAVKASTEPSFSGFFTPKREFRKAPIASKRTPVPGFSNLVTQKPGIPKAPPASKASTVSTFSNRVVQKPEILKAPSSSKATPVPSFSDRVTQAPKFQNAPSSSKADLIPEALKPLPSSRTNYSLDRNLPKPKVPLTTPINEAPCFSGRTAPGVSKASVDKKTPDLPGLTSKTSVAPPINGAPSSSGHAKKVHAIELETSERKSKRSKKKHREDPDRELEKLIANWKPELLVVHDEEDLGWLFSKSTKQSVVKADAVISDAKSCVESQLEKLRHINPAYAFQPRAQFLPEADIYALPYVVPF